MSNHTGRRSWGFLRRGRNRRTVAIIAAVVVTAMVGFYQFASAGTSGRGTTPTGGNAGPAKEPVPEAIAQAMKIPNDQGPAPECRGTPGPTPTAAPTPTAQPTPTADPTEEPPPPTEPAPTDDPTATAEPTPTTSDGPTALHHHGGGGTVPDSCHDDQGGPTSSDFIDIRQVPRNAAAPQRGPNASTGVYISRCGRNENAHRNSDNFIVAPGVTNGAHHTHDYVGNRSANGLSTNESLAAAGTTCGRNDKSVFFWPVLRRVGTVGPDQNADGGGNDGNVGTILRPTSVLLELRGNAKDKVVRMPSFLRIITGDAKATTNGPTNARAQWGCTGFPDRLTTKYPLCPRNSQVQRVLVFPSCWDGTNTDSANHRAHVLFPNADGACPQGTQAIPQLRMTLTYSVPRGRSFSLDSFPEQLHNPLTDHGDFENLMPDTLMAFAVTCINRGRRC